MQNAHYNTNGKIAMLKLNLKFGRNNIVDQSNDRAAKIYFHLYDK